MAMPEEIRKKLEEASVSAEAITALEDNGYDTEAALREASSDDLKDAGVGKGGDRAKIKALFSKVEAEKKPEETSTAGLAEAIKQMGAQFAQAVVAADREVCPHCSAVMPKNFTGKTCTKCGRPMKRTITCISCGASNEQVKDGDYCEQCGEVLVSGETRQQITYLMRVKGFRSGPAMAELKRLQADEKEWARFKEQVQAWVDEGGYADVASFFRAQVAPRVTF